MSEDDMHFGALWDTLLHSHSPRKHSSSCKERSLAGEEVHYVPRHMEDHLHLKCSDRSQCSGCREPAGRYLGKQGYHSHHRVAWRRRLARRWRCWFSLFGAGHHRPTICDHIAEGSQSILIAKLDVGNCVVRRGRFHNWSRLGVWKGPDFVFHIVVLVNWVFGLGIKPVPLSTLIAPCFTQV